MGACFEQKDNFPSIREAIDRLCKRSGKANHEAIIDELLKDPEASTVIDRAIRRCPQFNQRAMAGIMIAWLSQRYSSRPEDLGGGFHQRFKQEKRSGNWAYLLGKTLSSKKLKTAIRPAPRLRFL